MSLAFQVRLKRHTVTYILFELTPWLFPPSIFSALRVNYNSLGSPSAAEWTENFSTKANTRTTLLNRATLAWPVEPTCSADSWRAGCPRCVLGSLGSVRPPINDPPTCEDHLSPMASLRRRWRAGIMARSQSRVKPLLVCVAGEDVNLEQEDKGHGLSLSDDG